MITTAELSFKSTIDTKLEDALHSASKRLQGEFFFSDSTVSGKSAGLRTLAFDFPSKGKAKGFLRAAKKILTNHGKKLTRAFTRESLTDPNE